MALRIFTLALATAGIGCTGIAPAFADTPQAPEIAAAITPPLAKTLPADPTVTSATPAAQPDNALDDAALNDLRGSGGLAIGNQTLSSINSGNSTIGSYTAGMVNISSSALSNFNGLGNITINTGALSQLQSAMNVTVNVNP